MAVCASWLRLLPRYRNNFHKTDLITRFLLYIEYCGRLATKYCLIYLKFSRRLVRRILSCGMRRNVFWSTFTDFLEEHLFGIDKLVSLPWGEMELTPPKRRWISMRQHCLTCQRKFCQFLKFKTLASTSRYPLRITYFHLLSEIHFI
jgi:hypothetical protein